MYLLPKIHSKICVFKITRSSSKKIIHINENVNALLYFYNQIAKPLLLVHFFFFFSFFFLFFFFPKCFSQILASLDVGQKQDISELIRGLEEEHQ